MQELDLAPFGMTSLETTLPAGDHAIDRARPSRLVRRTREADDQSGESSGAIERHAADRRRCGHHDYRSRYSLES